MLVEMSTVTNPETGEERKVFPVNIRRFYPLDFDEVALREQLRRNSKMVQERGSALEKRGPLDPFGVQSKLTLDDTLQVLPSISIFSRYVRDIVPLSAEFANANEHVIVFAPTDKAIEQMSLKPWEQPANISELENNGASAEEIHNAIQDNISQFVLTHVVSKFQLEDPAELNTQVLLKSNRYPKSVPGGDILLKKTENEYHVASSNTAVYYPVEEVHVASNGVVLVIGSCLV